MASSPEYARLLLSKALDDTVALRVLLPEEQVTDEIIGFHAQQVIEKAIKSVLSLKSIAFRRTHDLAELIDLLIDNGIRFPASLEKAVELTPFAVEFRYDFLPPEIEHVERMQRDAIHKLVSDVIAWAKGIIHTEDSA